MSGMPIVEGVAVWTNEERCKGCDICVSKCPAGVLSMRLDQTRVLGKVIQVIHPESCIGCRECELHCPDFAIYVAERKDFKFAKLTEESKRRAEAIKSNGYILE